MVYLEIEIINNIIFEKNIIIDMLKNCICEYLIIENIIYIKSIINNNNYYILEDYICNNNNIKYCFNE
jgi:hypothetical protein